MTTASRTSLPALLLTALACAAVVLVAACDGPAGDEGAAGRDGDPGATGAKGEPGATGEPGAPGDEGPAGDPGQDGRACWDVDGDGAGDPAREDVNGDGQVDVLDCRGADARPASYVGAEACQECHAAIYDRHQRSGHAWAMGATGGERPAALPYGKLPVNPPPGQEDWSGVSYVVGGWGWKSNYVDAQGYLLTGALAQHGVADERWGPYQPEAPAGSVPFTCAVCHATGYDPAGHQDARPGITGSWQQDGVQCERCHGPGSAHADAPDAFPLAVDRGAELCGQCHVDGSAQRITAEGGFIRHQQQWSELFSSKKRVMDCIDCHDPHASAHHADPQLNPERSLRSDCQTCHLRQAQHQKSPQMKPWVSCVDCHMPRASRSAAGDLALHVGDVRSHLFEIDPEPTDAQFDERGTTSRPYLTIDWACRSCHRVGGSAAVVPDELLRETALGYHDPQP